MIENRRRAGIPERQQPVSIRTGMEGFADGMSMFPGLKEWENQIALQALREGKTVDELRNVTPFRQYLGVETRAYASGTQPREHSFRTLFSASPGIDTLVSLGNFHTIHTWTWTLAKRYPDLNLPLEQFFQDALYQIVPAQAKSYDPSYGRSFTSYVVSMLKNRLSSFVDAHKREYSSPACYEEKPASKKGRPKASRERVVFASLDAPMLRATSPQTFREFYEESHPAPVESTRQDDQEVKERIHLLSTLAGLSNRQEETLVALYVYGGDTKLISHMRRCTTRMVRMYRQEALRKLEELGYETVQGVLTGTYPTLAITEKPTTLFRLARDARETPENPRGSQSQEKGTV